MCEFMHLRCWPTKFGTVFTKCKYENKQTVIQLIIKKTELNQRELLGRNLIVLSDWQGNLVIVNTIYLTFLCYGNI